VGGWEEELKGEGEVAFVAKLLCVFCKACYKLQI
jgi:hypothetical protein